MENGGEQAVLARASLPLAPPLRTGAVIAVPLRRHQLQLHTWAHLMEQRTAAHFRGGLLLMDEMGLGKTLSVYSYVLARGWTRVPGGHWGTLIVVSVLDPWQSELTKHVVAAHRRRVRVVETTDQLRRLTAKRMCREGVDTVVVRYSTLTTLFNRKARRYDASPPLAHHKWVRIVLDEAHTIRNASTHTNAAVTQLHAVYRWAVTGTPYFNRIDDCYNLVRWVRGPAYDWGRAGAAPSNVTPAEHVHSMYLEQGIRRRAHAVLRVPQRRDRLLYLTLTPCERSFYTAVHSLGVHRVEQMLQAYEHADRVAKDRARRRTLEWLLRMKQATVHPYLVICRMRYLMRQFTARCDLSRPCPYTYEQVLRSAEHMLDEYADAPVGADGDDDAADAVRLAAWLPPCASTKGAAVLGMVSRFAGDKFLVVSQWAQTLRLVATTALDPAGVAHRTLSGAVPPLERPNILDEFAREPHIRVLLVTMGMAEARDITAANHVVILDQWWNDNSEDQAIARVHRWGQQRETRVWLLRVRRTLEMHVEHIRSDKRNEALTTFDGVPRPINTARGWVDRVRREISYVDTADDDDGMCEEAIDEFY